MKIIEMKKKIDKLLGYENKIILKNSRKWDTKKRLLASIKLANKTFGYKPLVNFNEGLKYNIDWFKENKKIIDLATDFPPGMSSAIR